jgi:hypothetical protein
MTGKHTIKISDSRVKYNLEISRNITIVQGNSGTGKTTLFDLISAYSRLKNKSNIQLSCDKACTVLRSDSDWKSSLKSIKNSIVFIDEESDYVTTQEFASAIKKTDNYYVIFTRENLYNIPYSVEEIYEIHTSGKIHTFRKLYKQQKAYRYSYDNKVKKNVKNDILLTEDSKSGFQLYEAYFSEENIKCISAGSNSSIYNFLKENKAENIFVIADGAAFGAEMNRIINLQQHYPNITLCLPESFEWLILKSGVAKIDNIDRVLESPENYIESSKYFSWEQFFEDYLIKNSKDTVFKYSKNKINKYYLVKSNSEKIVALIGIEK